MFKDELEYFISNQDKFVEKYLGKYLVIKDRELIGIYSNALDAYVNTKKTYKPGTFMIQECKPGTEAYTVTIASNNLVRYES